MAVRRAAIATTLALIVATGVMAAADWGDFTSRPLASLLGPSAEYRPVPSRPGDCSPSRVGPPPDEAVLSTSPPIEAPWRLGTLDDYRKGRWHSPPFESNLAPVPDLPGGTEVTIRTLACTAWPVPSDLRAVHSWPRSVEFWPRAQTISVTGSGPGPFAEYRVRTGSLKSVSRVDISRVAWPSLISTEGAEPGPRARTLVARAEKREAMWKRWSFLRAAFDDKRLLTSRAHRSAMPVRGSDVEAALREDEVGAWTLLASRALLARWAGIPTRIGYGYWRPEPTSLFRRRDTAAWLEVMSEEGIWTPLPKELAVYLYP